MTRLIGAVVVATALAIIGPSVVCAAEAAGASEATEFSAQRQHRRLADYRYRPRYRATVPPEYYDRPRYYRPYPYTVPVPFVFGLGFGPYW